MTVTISFVRNHQDLQKVKSEISHVENLNIKADLLARKARKHQQIQNYIPLPQNPIDFTINDTIINSKYALRSSKAYHSIAFCLYLQENYS
jgi:hypothetical protein